MCKIKWNSKLGVGKAVIAIDWVAIGVEEEITRVKKAMYIVDKVALVLSDQSVHLRASVDESNL